MFPNSEHTNAESSVFGTQCVLEERLADLYPEGMEPPGPCSSRTGLATAYRALLLPKNTNSSAYLYASYENKAHTREPKLTATLRLLLHSIV